MMSRESEKYPIVIKKIFPFLYPATRQLFPLETWDILAEYCLDSLDGLYCPLSGRLFNRPVMIDHPMLASTIYDSDGLLASANFERLERFGIRRQNIASFLHPV